MRFLVAICAVIFICNSTIVAMVYDNRYFPLIQKPYVTVDGRPSHLAFEGYVTTAHNAFGILQEVGIPEIVGGFDEAQLGSSLAQAGFLNPLPPLAAASMIPWGIGGKIQSQGVAFSGELYLTNHFALGLYGLAMRVNSTLLFMLTQGAGTTAPINGPGDIIILDDARRAMFQELNLACDHVSQHGFGDTELYARFSGCWKYLLKLRTLRVGGRIGTLIPTGVKRNIYQPASVPFGGNGHWGVYGSLDAEFEVKEDFKIGFWGRASKRFAKTNVQRMPLDQEQPLFGVVVGPARVNPGYTGIASLYFQVENLRDGFGLRAQYSLISHQEDQWEDERVNKTIPVNLTNVIKTSGWGAEYITLTAFYDFEKIHEIRGNAPIISASFDIPIDWLVGHRFVKSYKVSLGLEFNF